MKLIPQNQTNRSQPIVPSLPVHSVKHTINALQFADMMTKRIQSLNRDFNCGGKIRDGFLQYADAYNENVNENSSGGKLQIIVPAPTGSGKSVSARLYLAEIAKIGLSGLLVVSEVSEAIEAAITINMLAGEIVAGVYYSISEKHLMHDLWFDIGNLPRIAIISHALFIQRSDSEKDIGFLRTFEGRQRDIVIIDERIDLIKRVSFGTNEITEAVGILRRDKALYGEAQILSDFSDVYFSGTKNGSLRYNNPIKIKHHDFRDIMYSLIGRLQSGQYNLIQQIRGIKRNPATDRGNVINLLKRVSYVIESRYSNTVEGSNVVCHREENLSGKFGSVVVLDATASVNPEYEYRSANNHNLKYYNRINSRDYSNVTMNICSSNLAKQSKYAIYDKPQKERTYVVIMNQYLELIGSILKPGDQLLVVTFMDIFFSLKEMSPYGNQVKFIYWGSKDARGSNEYKDFNKALVIGWHRKPMHTYVQSVIAINPVDKYISSHGSVWSDVNHLKDMLIIDGIIQFFNRIRCRTAIDDQGNCKPAEFYCLTGGSDEMEELIRATIINEMPGIVIKEWTPKTININTKKITKTVERAENITRWLRGEIEKYEEKSLIEIRNHFNLTTSTLSRVIHSNVFKEMLDDEEITMITGGRNSQGNPVRFILPPHKCIRI